MLRRALGRPAARAIISRAMAGVPAQPTPAMVQKVSKAPQVAKPKLTDGQLVQAILKRSPHPLVDIGANLADEAFAKDRDDIMRRAAEANVGAMILTGTSVKSTKGAQHLCDATSAVPLYFTAGVHPHSAKDWDDTTLEVITSLASHPRCVAIGECGLDYDRDFSPRPVQLEVFEKQVQLAKRLDKPLFIHCREAGPALVEVLKRHLPVRGVVHCFTGTKEELMPLLEMGLHIGITGWVCDHREERSANLGALLPLIPVDRLMIETDCPYLTPRTIEPSKSRPRRNEPALLPWVLTSVATALGASEEEVAQRTTKTAVELFGLAPL